MANDNYGSVATPRIFVDYIQYAKAIGMVKRFEFNSTGLEGDDPSKVWDFNPANTATYTPTDLTLDALEFTTVFKNDDEDTHTAMPQFRYFMKTLNYGAVLNHNMGLLGEDRYMEATVRHSYHAASHIVGDSNGRSQIGYNLWGINYFNHGGGEATIDLYDNLGVKFNKGGEDSANWSGDSIKVGAISIGRYFDLPHSANLSLNQTISYDGVQTKRTIGGSDLTQINYKRPKWGDFSPWTHIDLGPYIDQGIDPQQAMEDQDYRQAGFQGRRSWDLSFSYISKDDMFPRIFSNNTGGYYDNDTSSFDDGDTDGGMYKDNVVNNWLNVTMGGQISHILQPDNDKPNDFAIVKMAKNSLQITQQAPSLYEFKVKLIEQF